MKSKVLIVDDSSFMRRYISKALAGDSRFEVVGFASNGKDALEQIENMHIDLITLDLEMPQMNGIETLKELRRRNEFCRVVVISTLTSRGAASSMEALKEGACDFILKPEGGSDFRNKAFREELTAKLLAISSSDQERTFTKTIPTRDNKKDLVINAPIELAAIGASTGGPAALRQIVAALTPDIPFPIVIAQHMPALFTLQFATELSRAGTVKVFEAEDNLKLLPGAVYLAKGGFNLKINHRPDGFYCRIEPKDDQGGRLPSPSVNRLFNSLEEYAASVLCILLTGIGDDGASAMHALHHRGAVTIVQEKDSCVVYGMPKAAVKLNCVDEMLTPNTISERINQIAEKRRLVRPLEKRLS